MYVVISITFTHEKIVKSTTTSCSSCTKCENCVIKLNFVDFGIQCNHFVNEWIVWTQHSNHSKKLLFDKFYWLKIFFMIGDWPSIVNIWNICQTSVFCVPWTIQWINEIRYYWPMSQADGIQHVQCAVYNVRAIIIQIIYGKWWPLFGLNRFKMALVKCVISIVWLRIAGCFRVSIVVD